MPALMGNKESYRAPKVLATVAGQSLSSQEITGHHGTLPRRSQPQPAEGRGQRTDSKPEVTGESRHRPRRTGTLNEDGDRPQVSE